MVEGFMNGLGAFLHAAFSPSRVQDIPIFYLIWMIAYLIIHVVLDARNPRTPPFRLRRLRSKLPKVENALTFATGLLLLLGILNPPVRTAAGDAIVPLIFAGLATLLLGLSEIDSFDDEKDATA